VIPLTLAEIARITGGTLADARGDEVVTAVEFDSRKAAPGTLFLGLPGERADGHDFAAAAVAQGAAGVLAGRPVGVPAVVAAPVGRMHGTYLGDTDPEGHGAAVLAALSRLATHVVAALPDLTVVGVTGSSGKTSTKDLIAAVLAPLGPTVAPPESFNNELGLPWTALRADAETRHLVLEFSARGKGHIAALAAAVPPRIGVVLNVGSAHLGEFGSVDAIAAAKGELVEALPSDGLAVLNAEDPRVAAMASRTAARVLRFGGDGDVRAEYLRLDAGRARFRLNTPDGSADVALGLVGEHHVGNALAAAAVALACGATPDVAAAVLSAARPVSRRRMEVTDRADGVTVVNDAYNANPDSMRAALRALRDLGSGRRTWAVLGPMRELGPDEDAEHARIAALAGELGIDELVAVGSPAYGAPREVADVDGALDLLRAELAPGDVVLVKASRAAGLDRVADALLRGATAPATITASAEEHRS
jgi:UDP-N-acetylmuramoyl-tripeptide--D-alanyl-D-alanine ligase